jgi:O-antigen ligase
MVYLWCDRLVFISLCLLIFVLPITVAGVEIVSALTILLFLIKKVVAISAGRKDPLALPRPVASVSIAVGLFLLVCFVSIFFSVQPSLSIKGFFAKTLKAALLFFAVQESMTTPSRVMWFLRIALVSAFIVCLDGLWQRYSGFDLLRHNAMIEGRINASFNHPNSMGAYLVVMIPVCLALCWDLIVGKNRKDLVLRVCGAGIAAAVLMLVMGLTFSRGAWLGLVCAGLVFFLFDKRTWFPCLLIAGLFFAVFHPLLTHGRHVTLITDNLYSSGIADMRGTGRITYWQDAWRIISENPVFGTGLNTYLKVIQDTAQASQNHAHNCYLQVTAELGFVGLAAMMWVFGAVFLCVRRKVCAEPSSNERLVLIALISGWIGLLVQSGVDNIFYSVQLNVFLWVMMGLAVAFPSREVPDRSENKSCCCRKGM